MDPKIAAKIEIDSKVTIVFMSIKMISSFDRSIPKTYDMWENTIRNIFKLCQTLEHLRKDLIAIKLYEGALNWWLKKEKEDLTTS